MKTILFQGDSITDAYRDRCNDDNRGLGYPHLVSAKMGFENPGEYNFINRGVSGDRVVDLYARIKRDCINLKPDFMSILIGTNDVWHELGDSKNGVDTEKFERIYCMFIDEVLEAVPDIKIVIMGAYVTHGTATDSCWETFHTEISQKAAAAKRVAEKYGFVFVDLQSKFDEAEKQADASYWTIDGVHPTPFGHALIAKAWQEAYDQVME